MSTAPALPAHQANDLLLPQPPGGQAAGALLSLVVHAALVAALVAMTHWRTRAPEVVTAELWAGVPEAAAPTAAPAAAPAHAAAPAPAPVPAPAPPPAPAPAPAPKPAPAPQPPVTAPPKVDIATERAAKVRAERERREAEAEAAKRRKAEAEKAAQAEREREAAEQARREQAAAKAAAAEQERIDRSRDDQLRRLMAQAGQAGQAGQASQTGSAGSASAAAERGSAARDGAPSAAYSARLASLIRSQTVFSGDVPGNPAAEVEVRAAPTGTILSRRLVKSSGHAAWDDAVLRAIDRVGTLPRDADGRVPSTLIVAFRPKE